MSSKRLIIYGIVALCLLGLYVAGRRSAQKPKPTASGNLAPDFTLTDLDGHKLTLSDYRGKVVLLDFWATWCGPCRTEIPHFVEMQNKYGPQGFQVIGISMDDDAKPVHGFAQQYKLNYPIAVGDDKLADRFGGVMGLPVNFIIDRQGRIHAKYLGATDVSVFDSDVNDLLSKP
jgi:cytochrome c biogenesis protein CcmG, thiol:disulfide interchange protein DsbE